MTIRMINRLVAPTGTPDMVLNGSGVTNVATTFGVVAVPSNLGTTGNVTLLVYAPGDTNPEIMTMTSRSSLTLTVTREAEEATAYPKCAHAAGAGVWIVETAANLTAFINQLIAATAAPNFSALSDVLISGVADGDVPIWNAGAGKWENGPQTGGGGSGTDGSAYMLYQEQQPQNTVAGTFTSGTWQTRKLNVEVADPSGHGVLSGNQITLDAGTYELRGWANAHDVAQNRLRWRNITDSVDVLYGNSAYMASGTADDDGVAVIEGRFTITTPKVFELQHICTTTKTSDGFGTPGNFAVEIYSGVELRRVGDLVAPTVRELVLPSNYSIPNGSWGDVTGMSLTLAAGSYLVTGQFAHWNPSNNGSMDIILVDNSGATVYAQTTGSQSTTFFGGTLPMIKKIVLAAATTLKVQARANSAGWLIKTDDQLAVVTAGFGTVLTFTPCN